MIPIKKVDVRACEIPTDAPESDGTLQWNSTCIVIVEITAGGMTGLGYSYTDAAAAHVIDRHFVPRVEGSNALDIPQIWNRMVHEIRNLGRDGITATAIAAVDTALWDLKARLLDVPLASLFGSTREAVPIYGSGGFTSYAIPALQKQLSGWAEQGISRVKMKVGRDPDRDVARVKAAREAIGPTTELFVDANGAYGTKQALAMADAFAESDVRWFEEPVSSDDLKGLHLIRERAPVTMEIAAGEYGYNLTYFDQMLAAGAVDVLQADVTRCAGYSRFMDVGALCYSRGIPLSSHCSPALHLAPCLSLQSVRHMEYFHDHVRIENMIFDGAPQPRAGFLSADLSQTGNGLTLKEQDLDRHVVYRNAKS